MKTLKNLKAIIIVTEFNNSVVVSELSGNVHFIDDIKEYCGWVEDVFHGTDIPKEKGFYEFNGNVDISTDMNGYVDDTNYHGEFKKIKVSELPEDLF